MTRPALCLLALLWPATRLPAQEQATDAVPRANPLAGVEKLPPEATRGEADDDRVTFTVHLLQARLAQGRGERAEALRHYQRAWRYAPEQTSLLREIVALAFALKRNDEALRYAALSAQAEGADPLLLRRLALVATSRRQWAQAVKLFESGQRLDEKARQPGEKLDQAALTVKLEMGRLYFLAGDYERSAASFAVVRAALADPQSGLSDEARQMLLDKPAETYALWAESFLAAGKTDDAEALFRQADEAMSDPATLAFQLARVEAARGNPSSARRELEEYFATKSTSSGIEPYNLFAEMVAKHQPDPVQARKTVIDRFERRAAQDPENLPLKLSLAGQYLAANQLDKAEPLLVAVVKVMPTAAAYEELTEIYHRQNKFDKLLAIAAEVAKRTTSLDLLGEAGQKVAASKGTMQRLIDGVRLRRRTRPDSLAPDEVLAVGLLALAAKEYNAADELLAAAAEQQPEKAETILLRWGFGMMLADQYPRAASAFGKLIDRQPPDEQLAQGYYYLAGALELAGQTDAALAAAKSGAEKRPDDPRFAGRAAWVLYHAKRTSEAKAAYTEFVAKFDKLPEETAVREAAREARLVLSNLENVAGDFNAATEWLQQVLDEFPEDAGASNDLGYLWADKNAHLQRAQRLIELAVNAEPENHAYRDSLGWVYFRQGKFAEAVVELEKAAANEKADGVILEHLGDALGKTGRTSEARAAWLRAEAAFQKDRAADKLKRVREKLEEPKNQAGKEPKNQRTEEPKK